MAAPLRLTREHVLAYRRRVGALDERLPHNGASLRRAAWAGVQDSMPRAALLSLHARVEGVRPTVLDHASLAQVWGPRFSTYVIPRRDLAVFTVGRHPDDARGQERAERMARELHALLGSDTATEADLGSRLGFNPSLLRYATTTGTVEIRWDGARAPAVWAVPPPAVDPETARVELARRHLRVFGPTTSDRFARWAGISRRAAAAAHARLGDELVPVRTPLGDEWLLASDAEEARGPVQPPAAARVLPSGDAYTLLDGVERTLLVPEAERRALLWTPRVWPGALLVEGKVVGTWRRAGHLLQADPWQRLSRAARAALEAEAAQLPLPGLDRPLELAWGSSGTPRGTVVGRRSDGGRAR